MKSSAKKIELASVDDLFSTEEGRQDAKLEKIQEIPLSELHPFKNHPFKVKDDEAMMETADSIKQYGVLVPAIARPDPEGGYELVAGHRRHRASELADKETMPVIVRDLDDDAATIIMVDSNLQRESLLPSERAFAYKMKLDAMKRQAGRPSKENCSQVGNDFGKKSSEVLAEQVGQSKNQIFRYIRLTELIPELMDMVDEKKIALNPAYELSFLKKEEQVDLLDAMDSEQATPSLSQAQRLKKYSQEGHLTLDMMRVIMGEEKKSDLDRVTFTSDTLRKYFPIGGKVEKDYSAAEFESLTEQQRAKLGLRTFILEDLLPPKALPQAGQQMELRNFCFAYKNEPETLHIRESKIPANRIVGIIGNNGAGKSTFSRCFCGLEKRCGEVIWNGRTYRPKDRLNTCYMVMQEVNHQLFTETVLDEVLISMEEENQEWAEEILAELDLIGFKDRHPMSLSGGQKQRVAIASAIASKRSILFFDEPTSGLDYKHMKEVANVLKQVRDAGITLYVITHDLELLLDCCTDIVHFEDGSIIDKFQMDEAGLEKIRNYFIKGVPTK